MRTRYAVLGLALLTAVLLPERATAQTEQDSVLVAYQLFTGSIPPPGSGCFVYMLGSHDDPIGNGRDADYSYPWNIYPDRFSDGYSYPEEPPGSITDEPGVRVVFVGAAGTGGCDYISSTVIPAFQNLFAGLPPRYAYFTPPPNEPPTARFTWSQSETEMLKIDVDASGSEDADGEIVSYRWDFGNGETGSGMTTSYTYYEAGEYEVTLTVRDDDGDEDETSRTVEVEGPDLRYVVALQARDAAGKRTQDEQEPAFQVGDTVAVRIAVENTGDWRLEEIRLPEGEATIEVTTDPEEALAFVRGEQEEIGALAPGEADTLAYLYEVVEAADLSVLVGEVTSEAVHPDTGERTTYAETETSCTVPGKSGPLQDDDTKNVPCASGSSTSSVVVNATGDAPLGTDDEGNPLTTCDTGGDTVTMRDGTKRPECTLRAAIELANAGEVEPGEKGKATIAFDIPKEAPTIQVGAPLAVEVAVIIDGTTQPGYDAATGQPVIEVRGGDADGFVLTAEGTEVRGLAILLFAEAGIRVQASGALIEHNFIGTDRGGVLAGGNKTGVYIEDVGGAHIRDNLVSGNEGSGIHATGTGATGITIEENRIGTTAAGDEALGNATGIFLEKAPGNLIRGNLISGNRIDGVEEPDLDDFEEGGSGIFIWGAEATGNRIEGNILGTDKDVEALIRNVVDITIAGASGNAIGGASEEARNYIASRLRILNTRADLGGGDAQNTVVQGNYFGTNRAGTRALGTYRTRDQAEHNIDAQGRGTIIGGSDAGAGNLIMKGIDVEETGTRITGNLIGLQPGGEQAIEDGDCLYGILLNSPDDGSLEPFTERTNRTISDNRIGHCGTGIYVRRANSDRILSNTIFKNGGSGIRTSSLAVGIRYENPHHPDELTAVTIRANSIYDNGRLGINLGSFDDGDDDVTENDSFWGDSDSGANGLQNFPRFYNAGQLDADGNFFIAGEIPGASDPGYVVDLYHNERCNTDVNGRADIVPYGEGKNHLGSVEAVETGLFGVGDVEFTFTLEGASDRMKVGELITATATAPDGSTSEFSRCMRIMEAARTTASAEIDPDASDLAFDDEGVTVSVTDATGKTHGGSADAAGMLYVTRYETAPDWNVFAEMAATAPDGQLIQPRSLAADYWYLADRALTVAGGLESALYAFEVCLDPTGLVAEDALEESLVMQRSETTGWLWMPLATSLKEHGGTRYACAEGLTALGEFSLGSGSEAALAAPLLTAPEDDATEVDMGAALFWQGVPDAASYDLQVAVDPGFRALLADTTGLAATTATPDSLARSALHYWRVRGVTASGEAGPWSTAFRFVTGDTGVSTEDDADVPDRFVLEANYPNPFNPTTTIGYVLPEASAVRLVVYDVLGRQVAVLVDGPRPAGQHEATFEATNLPSGMYLYRIEANGFTQTRRMLLVK